MPLKYWILLFFTLCYLPNLVYAQGLRREQAWELFWDEPASNDENFTFVAFPFVSPIFEEVADDLGRFRSLFHSTFDELDRGAIAQAKETAKLVQPGDYVRLDLRTQNPNANAFRHDLLNHEIHKLQARLERAHFNYMRLQVLLGPPQFPKVQEAPSLNLSMTALTDGIRQRLADTGWVGAIRVRDVTREENWWRKLVDLYQDEIAKRQYKLQILETQNQPPFDVSYVVNDPEELRRILDEAIASGQIILSIRQIALKDIPTRKEILKAFLRSPRRYLALWSQPRGCERLMRDKKQVELELKREGPLEDILRRHGFL